MIEVVLILVHVDSRFGIVKTAIQEILDDHGSYNLAG